MAEASSNAMTSGRDIAEPLATALLAQEFMAALSPWEQERMRNLSAAMAYQPNAQDQARSTTEALARLQATRQVAQCQSCREITTALTNGLCITCWNNLVNLK